MKDWPSNWRSDSTLGPRIDGLGRADLEREVYAARRAWAALASISSTAALEVLATIPDEDPDDGTE